MAREDRRTELRRKLQLDGLLPTELDTDFQLDRWLDCHNDQIEPCAAKFGEYVRSRRALGFCDNAPSDAASVKEALDKFYGRDNVRRFHQAFAVSRLDGGWVNETDNGIVFVEMGLADPDTALAEFSIGEYLRIFFAYCEHFQRLILQREALTGRRSHGICIFDMGPMSMMQFANPYAPINRLFQARVYVWMNYFGEMLKHIVIVNPPRFIGLFFKMLSVLMPAHAVGRFTIAKNCPRDVEKLISLSAIPREYGGSRDAPLFLVDTAGKIDNGQTNGANKEPSLDRLIDLYGLDTANAQEVHVLSGESFCVELQLKPENQIVFYEYDANRDVEVSFIDDDGNYLMARFQLSTALRAESDALQLPPSRESTYGAKLEIRNLSKLMKMKLKIAVKVL